MSTDPVTIPFFLDNWAYLKTELGWLDRVLMVSVSRQRKEDQGVARVAKTAADRVSSHWWQGMISLDGGKAAYDEHRPTSKTTQNQPGRYQQQLEARIRASQQQGIVLALPLLCDRLNLTVIEKNIVLMALAPEVNRRYGQLYRFLQGEGDNRASDLPTVDLALRLLCRNDAEWRNARSRLSTTSPLVKRGLVRYHPESAETLLSQRIQLVPPLLDFLLAEAPTPTALDGVLEAFTEPQIVLPWTNPVVSATWDDLVLPPPLLQDLQRLCWQMTASGVLEEQDSNPVATGGAIALFAGRPGTGKGIAAEAIAHHLNLPLVELDLATVPPEHYEEALQALERECPPLVLLRNAEVWLRRSASVCPEALNRWLRQRQEQAVLTILSVAHGEAVALKWRRQMTILHFPKPGVGDRQILWQRAFPSTISEASELDWSLLAKQFSLTGGEIGAIAQAALREMAIVGASQLTYDHLAAALQAKGLRLMVPKKGKGRRRQRAEGRGQKGRQG